MMFSARRIAGIKLNSKFYENSGNFEMTIQGQKRNAAMYEKC